MVRLAETLLQVDSWAVLDWNAIRATLKAQVVVATGIPAIQIAYKNEAKAGTWLPYPQVELRLGGAKSVGHDSIDRKLVADAIEVTVHGPREARFQVRIISDNQNTAESVGDLSEYVRTRFNRESVQEALTVAGLGLNQIGETVEADVQRDDGRWLSVGITDIVFNLYQNDVDTTDSGDYIETVIWKSLDADNNPALLRPDGTPANEQIDLTVTVPED